MAATKSRSTRSSRKTTPKPAATSSAAPKKKSAQQKAADTRKRKAAKLARTRKRIETGKLAPAAVLAKLPPELKAVSVGEFVGWVAGPDAGKLLRGIVLNPEVELQSLEQHVAERLATRLTRRA